MPNRSYLLPAFTHAFKYLRVRFKALEAVCVNCDVMQFRRCVPMVRSKFLPPSYALKMMTVDSSETPFTYLPDYAVSH